MSDGWANALPCPPLATPMVVSQVEFAYWKENFVSDLPFPLKMRNTDSVVARVAVPCLAH